MKIIPEEFEPIVEECLSAGSAAGVNNVLARKVFGSGSMPDFMFNGWWQKWAKAFKGEHDADGRRSMIRALMFKINSEIP